MEKRKKKRGREKRKREIIDAFYPETPRAGLESLLCFLCLSLVRFPSFFLPSITHSSAVSSSLSHSVLCLHSHSALFSSFNLLLFTFHASSVMLFATLFHFLCL